MRKRELVSSFRNKVEELVELLDQAEDIFDSNSRMERLLKENDRCITRLRTEMHGWRAIARAHMEAAKPPRSTGCKLPE